MLAVEAIPEELRETVRFLNVHSTSGLEVLALELSYRQDGDVEILVPQTWGEETAKPPPGGRPQPIDRETLLDRIGEQTPAAEAAEAILDWAESEPKLQVRYTTGQAAIETPPPRRSFLYISQNGNIHVELKTLRKHGDSWSEESSEQLVQDLEDIGVHLDTTRNSPRAPIEPLADEARRHRFFELMERARKALAG